MSSNVGNTNKKQNERVKIMAYRLLNEAEFKRLNIDLNEYRSSAVQDTLNLAKNISVFHPAIAKFEVTTEDGKNYFESAFVFLEHKSLSIRISYDSYRKKYEIICTSFWQYPNTSREDISKIEKSIEKPQYIGVLTTKKIQNWIAYFEKCSKLIEEASKKNKDKTDAFRRSIAGYPVRWFDTEKKNGEIARNGIVYSFTISENYISENIKFDTHVSANLETFEKLSANQYTMKNED